VPSLNAPPSLAEVQAEVSARELLIRPTEREQRRRDYQHAAVIEPQQALQQIAPGVGVAWQYTRGAKLPVIPLDPVSLQPVGEAITDPMATLEHWSQPANWAHAVGVRLGRPSWRAARAGRAADRQLGAVAGVAAGARRRHPAPSLVG
jgi:hypothetical protein